MYLKSIEVQGFKSFANKINFEFHKGITGIVGPNGSGKSNVADAVRWVLGEQRIKQLRGESMQDVIFSGTELRKPLGYAYVAITFDNSDHKLAIDYEEVTVARRIYRSGESEYSINGTPCRLKDVNELFYDTGIGKEGYSIIGQGQIEKILSGKPEEKRELFDEAAGIVKFKKRKATAQKKLEDEKQNLIRVNDILSELEKQVGPLEKQSEKAKIYLKKKEELKELDVNMFLLENSRIREQLADVEEKYRIAKDDYDETIERYEKVRTEYDSIQARIEELEQEIESTRNTLTDTSVMRGKLEGEINVLKEQIKSAQGNEKHFEERIATIATQLQEKEAEKTKIHENKAAFDQKVAEMEQERNAARASLSQVQARIEELNNIIEVNKNKIIQTLSDRANIKSKIGSFDAMLEQLRIRKAELNSRLLRAKSDEAERDAEIKALQEEFKQINDEIIDTNSRLTQMDEEHVTFRERLMKKDEEIRAIQSKYQSLKSKLDTISNLTERYEGYGNSIQKVMEQKEKNKGIVGVVADIIKVDKEYETAIETALGGNIQNIVTDDEETAKKMIGFLKQNRFGRATFLPLTSITNPQEFKTPDVLKEKGAIGLADSLVKTDSKYANVAKAMLGRIAVIDNIDNAVKIARKYDYGVRMVTLEGELLVPGGAISGGAFRNNSNLLGRRREIDELEEKLKNTKDALDKANNDLENLREERTKLRRAIEEEKSKLQDLFIKQNTARLNVVTAEERKEEAEKGFGDLKQEELEIEQKVQEINKDKESIQDELKNSESDEKAIEQEVQTYQKELETYRIEESDKTGLVGEWDVEYEKMLQKQEFEQTNLERIEGEVARLSSELTEVQEGLANSRAEVELRQHNIEEIAKTINASNSAQSDAEISLKEKQQTKEELSQKQKNFFSTREEISERKNALDKEVYRLNSQREKLEESMESHINYMWNEYEITLSSAASMRNDEMTDIPTMRKQISGIKDEIKKLGDVNVNAIEDYKNLMERYTFLKNQHDDLIEAEKTLEGIIQELDTAMRKQFAEKFEEIKREFDKVFKELFGGGKGTLELIEEEDILEAGIRIIAQPPGKKLQNMMQLSGGEKSFTAIALLFAIQNLKPSPFCLLDEIEAALDEQNVSRFAKYLNKLTKYTQFIVITHRRGTMEQADRLYGITMQEKGVSTLVSVSLIDSALDN
ncbi:MAG: chromosome segregation protein SMC [Lachnospiraceae bacterium]|nr:chromosome segregation protein SMC [Lachnospiraceae bacterium]MEE1256702.1 chromosome segregation protein SMC [Lachnospiraceae bacterium]